MNSCRWVSNGKRCGKECRSRYCVEHGILSHRRSMAKRCDNPDKPLPFWGEGGYVYQWLKNTRWEDDSHRDDKRCDVIHHRLWGKTRKAKVSFS